MDNYGESFRPAPTCINNCQTTRKMQTIQAPRASAILYNMLVSQRQAKLWLLPANICPIVPVTFLKAKTPFEFVDISPENFHMDLNQAEARMEKRDVGGLFYAHTYGDESTPEEFFARAKTLNPELLIVDDRCLCIPTFETNSSADLVLFSTGYAKVVELNSGGYALLREGVDYEPVPLKFDPVRHEELERSYKAAVQNRTRFDYRDADWLQTVSELSDWKIYRRMIEVGLEVSLLQRRMLNAIYASRLPAEIQLPPQYRTWRFNIRVMNKQEVMKEIFDSGLFASSHYASLAGIMSDGHAHHAEALAKEAVNLFNDHHFTAEMAERVCEIIVKMAKW